ncbi:DUF1365 domain-containing protein [Oceanibacterium hippocampi]|uniref:DUF1365 domain-containing protein n=1 Tax=Oceanibacterium hippocampi TaxID=745714 RepID=A0A1Y5TWL0_9PROT|nr:DUF1365 domain-containing protein [Oceanibacterium hippocampi]SLN74882.1 hypothetical protein OCH7691_03817 [Oceanibacterium hippocampi]
MSGDPASAILAGIVRHRRLRPFVHDLRYRVFSLLLDLDELPVLDDRLRLFAYNRRGLFAFHDRDHGPGDGRPLRGWIERVLSDAGIAEKPARIRILCFPRLLGHVFNPISVYFCLDAEGGLIAMLCEVSNTFGLRHVYLLPAEPGDSLANGFRQACDKALHVSPFIDMAMRYRFHVVMRDGRFRMLIHTDDGDGPLLVASHGALAQPLGDRAILRLLIRHPLSSWKIIAGIHWEAWRLWRKGARFRRSPPAPATEVTVAPRRQRERFDRHRGAA